MNNSPLNIKALREQAGLSQHELAALIKVSQPLIVAYESGGRSPNARRLPVIANALGVKISDLFIADSPVESSLFPVPSNGTNTVINSEKIVNFHFADSL